VPLMHVLLALYTLANEWSVSIEEHQPSPRKDSSHPRHKEGKLSERKTQSSFIEIKPGHILNCTSEKFLPPGCCRNRA